MKERETSEVYEFGAFRMDPKEGTLLRGGSETVALTPKSFHLLCLLLRNSGKLLDKNFLLNSVWPDAAVEENSLAKAVAEIRRALGEGPRDNRFISTVARRGYRFIPKVTTAAASPEIAGRPDTAVPATAPERAIILAVLPFTWLTLEGSDSSLSVGVADALITRLSNLPQLVVRPTTSILKYTDGDWSPAQIATALKADYLVAGSLQQCGEQVRVTVQMISPGEQRSVWASQFEETLTHLFSIEDAISDRLAGALALQLTTDQRQSLSRPGARSNESWQFYLRGRYFLTKRTLASAQQSIACFHQALAIDHCYAQAWAAIAEAHLLIGYGALAGWLPPHDTYPEAKRAARAAIEIDDKCAEAHASLGLIGYFYDWDPAAAAREFGRALSLHPHCVNAHHWYATVCAFQAHHREAILAIDRALEIEPLSLLLNSNKGYILYFARRYNDAVMQLRTTLEMDPSFAPAHQRLGLAYGELGLEAEAIRHLEQALRLSADNPQVLAALGHLHGRMGNRAAARAILAQMVEQSRTSYVTSASMAEVCVGLGALTEAFHWMEEALRERTSALLRFRVDPRFDCVRSNPGFEDVFRKVRPRDAAPGRS